MNLTLTTLWPLLAAVCAALTLHQILSSLMRPGRFAAHDLAAYALGDAKTKADDVPVGSPKHKIRLAFGQFGLDATGREDICILMARLGLGLAAGVAIYLFGFPLLAALAGLVIGWLMVDVVIADVWRKQQFAIERELPTFLASLAVTLQAVPNVNQALDDVIVTLDEKGPLQAWLTRMLARLHTDGRNAFEPLMVEAQAISSALGLAVFELKRLAETGGAGYGEAFVMAADSLGSVLEARAVAASKGDNARGAVQVVLGAMLFILILLAGSPAFREAFYEPFVQVLYLVLAGVVAFGMKLMNDMVDEAMA